MQNSEKSCVKWTSIAMQAIPRIIQAHQTMVQLLVAALITRSSRKAHVSVNGGVCTPSRAPRWRRSRQPRFGITIHSASPYIRENGVGLPHVAGVIIAIIRQHLGLFLP